MAWKLFWDLLCVAIDGCLLLKKDGFCRFQSSCGAVAFSSPNWMFWWVLCNVNTCVVLWPLVSELDDSLNSVMDMHELLCLKKWSVGTDIVQPREGLWTSSIVWYLMAACCSQRIGSVGWLLFLTSTPSLSHLVVHWHLVVWTLNFMFLSIVYIWIYLYELLGLNKGTGVDILQSVYSEGFWTSSTHDLLGKLTVWKVQNLIPSSLRNMPLMSDALEVHVFSLLAAFEWVSGH